MLCVCVLDGRPPTMGLVAPGRRLADLYEGICQSCLLVYRLRKSDPLLVGGDQSGLLGTFNPLQSVQHADCLVDTANVQVHIYPKITPIYY